MTDDPSQLSDFSDWCGDPAEDPLFNIDRDNPNRIDIFTRKEPLKVGHVPGSARIVGRNEKIKDIATGLRPIVQNDPLNNAMIYGETGMGRSLVARHVTKRACRAVESNGVSVRTVYIDCTQHNTQTRIARTMTREFNKTEKTDLDVPRAGIGSGEYYDYLWEILNLACDAVVIILDEVGRLSDDDILIQFSQARESGKTDCHLSVIAVSNKIEYRDQLNERVKSSLREEEFVFQSYGANRLRGTMKHCRDTFRDDVLSDDTIPLTAALAAQKYDDAREAIEILQHAGELAERENADQVVAEHIRDTQEWAEADQFEGLLRGLTTQVKFILYSLVLLIRGSSSEDESPTSRIYERYQSTTETVDAEVLSEHRVYKLLREQAFLDVVESIRTGDGRGGGSYLEHRLVQDIGIVLESVLRDSRLEDLA